MAQNFKRAFSKNRVAIVQGLENGTEVADAMYTSEIFTAEMKDAVHQEEEKEKRNRKILDTCSYRGKRAVKGLHDAFLETENKELAELLAPYVIEIHREENKYSPAVWPPFMEEQTRMEEEPVIKITDLKHPNFIHEYTAKEKEVYKMRNKTRGMAYIINNINFAKNDLPKRLGSEHDGRNLQQLFTELQFEVKNFTDLTAKEMIQFLEAERNKVNWDDMECVILVIMSHGVTTGIYGKDGHILALKKMTDVFDSGNCPGLNEKPRLVFVQACRVENKDKDQTEVSVQKSCGADKQISGGDKKGVQVENQSNSVVEGVKNMGLNTETGDQLDSAPVIGIQSLPKTVHSAADYLIAYATPEGNLAYRHESIGSWFLNAVTWTFKYHAHNTEIQGLMTKVNDLVSNAKTLKGLNTVSECKSSLRKKLFFFPGVYDNPPNLLITEKEIELKK